jgi:hypothetical protein
VARCITPANLGVICLEPKQLKKCLAPKNHYMSLVYLKCQFRKICHFQELRIPKKIIHFKSFFAVKYVEIPQKLSKKSFLKSQETKIE